MKRLFSFVASFLVLCIFLTSCAQKPKNVSREAYKYGKIVVNTVDDYLNSEIDLEDARSKIDNAYTSYTWDDDDYISDVSIGLIVSVLNLELSSLEDGLYIYDADDLIDSRNRLADILQLEKILVTDERSDSSDQAAELAEKSVKIVDNFLDGNIDPEEAIDQLDDLCKNTSDIYEFDAVEKEIHVSVITMKLCLEYYSTYRDEMLIETRNSVASFAGIPARSE